MSEDPPPKRKRKLKARDPKKVCGAKTPNGPFQQWKGFKTSHPRTGRCNCHGGATPNQTKAAKKEMATERMRTYGVPIDTDPLNAPLGEAICRHRGLARSPASAT